jgi:hypothetical protein
MIERLALVIACLSLGIGLIAIGYPEVGKGIVTGSLMVGLPLLIFYAFGGKYKITYNLWQGSIVKFEYPKWKWLLFFGYPILSQIEAKVAFRLGGEESRNYSAWRNAIWEDTNNKVTRVDRPCIKRLYLDFDEYRRHVHNWGLMPFIGEGAILLKIRFHGTEENLASYTIKVLEFRLCVDSFQLPER